MPMPVFKPIEVGFRALGGLLVAALFISGCGKSDSSPAPSRPLSREEKLDRRFAWNRRTLLDPYQKAGFANPSWDEPVRIALTEFAGGRVNLLEEGMNPRVIFSNCLVAVRAGCTDPMVRYLLMRFSSEQGSASAKHARDWVDAALALQKSSYPPIRKYYAWLHTWRALRAAYNGFDKVPDDVARLLPKNVMTASLEDALADPEIPPQEIYEACTEGLKTYRRDAKLYADFYQRIEGSLFKKRVNEPVVWLVKGETWTEIAWQARGSGYADSITDEGRKAFKDGLAEAERALDRAWQLDPTDVRIPMAMLNVELGQGKGRDRMELWFGRAMELNTNNFMACRAKLNYLEPKWYGSREAMIAFGRECVASATWGGRVPLALLDAHENLSHYLSADEQSEYWRQPDVWPDLNAAFERFFALNPQSVSWYQTWALYAYRCDQWDKLNELIPKFERVDYNYFGGRTEYERMVDLAAMHSGKAATNEPPVIPRTRQNR